MSRVNNYLDYINNMAQDDSKALVAQSESRYKAIIDNITDNCKEKTKGRLIIMLAGPSASGKTTTAHKIRDSFISKGIDCHSISLDDFYLDRDKIPGYDEGDPDYETVYALDIKLIDECLESLLAGKETIMPEFSFEIGRRLNNNKTMRLDETDVVIVEGLHALNPVITENLPQDQLLKIYISVASRIYDEETEDIVLNKRNLRFVRRLVRDYNFRASSVENTYKLWDNVRVGEDKYLFVFKDNADFKINTIHIYEPCVLKSKAMEMLSTVTKDSEYYGDAKRLMKALSKFNDIPVEMVPYDSLLREFLGK